MNLAKPYLIPVFFLALWLIISASFAVTSGWLSLAQRFRALVKPYGEAVYGQVKQIGLIPERAVTHMIVSPDGFYLYASLLFRFLRPALLLPWSEVHYARTVTLVWWPTYQFDLASMTSIRVTQRAYDAMAKYVK